MERTVPSTTTRLLDDDWIVVIETEVAAMPETLADVTDPYTVGAFEAEQGKPCCPLAHYARLGDIEQYIIGWKDANTNMIGVWAARGDATRPAYADGLEDGADRLPFEVFRHYGEAQDRYAYAAGYVAAGAQSCSSQGN